LQYYIKGILIKQIFKKKEKNSAKAKISRKKKETNNCIDSMQFFSFCSLSVVFVVVVSFTHLVKKKKTFLLVIGY